MEKSASHFYEFDGFLLDARRHVLYKAGEPLHVTRKVVELLVLLVRHSGHVVDKETLFAALWPDSVVEESNLTQTVYMLRKALGESANQTQYVETIPRCGYRFTAVVTEREGSPGLRDDDCPPDAETVATTHTPSDHVAPETIHDGPRIIHGGLLSLLLSRPRVVTALTFCVILASALAWRSARREVQPPTRVIESVAILPFRTVGAATQDNDHLGLGMTDTLITRLSSLKQVSVRPTSAVMKYSDASEDPRVAGRELGVDAVMDGTVQRDGEHVRVTVRLIRTDGEESIWAEKFDEPFTNVFALQDRISERVVGRLHPKLSGAQQRDLVKQHTTSLEAYRAYAAGLFFWNKRTREAMAKAVESFERAVADDPNYALAFAALSDAYFLSGRNSFDFVPRTTAFEKASAAATRALALDETLAESHLAVAMVSQLNEQQWPEAEAHFKRAIELNPYHATVRQRYGWHLIFKGRLDEGVSEMRHACELDPVSTVNAAAFTSALIFARQYDEAITVADRALEFDPSVVDLRFNRSIAYGLRGMYAAAIAELKKLREHERDGHTNLEALAIIYALAGRRSEAEQALHELRELARGKDSSVSTYNIALIYASLGRRNEAFEWLESLPTPQSRMSFYFRYDPHLDPLRADPRFQQFLNRHQIAQR